MLADINDADRLGVVGELIIGVESGPDLIERIADLQRRPH